MRIGLISGWRRIARILEKSNPLSWGQFNQNRWSAGCIIGTIGKLLDS
jgi:hypothetical protein